MKLRLLDLGAQDGFTIQTVYEAVARCENFQDTLILCHPERPYVCPGVHQVVKAEIDTEFCKEHEIPIVRRQTGGGTVYNDTGQQFYQIVLSKQKSKRDTGEFYENFLKPTIYCYKKFGLPAVYKPLNDVVINGRKASGNAAMSAGGANILIGNIMLDPDVETMARVLKVPSEKFRDKLAENISGWITSLKKELGEVPEREQIKDYYLEGWNEMGFEFEKGSLTVEEKEKLNELISKFKSKEWIYKREFEHPELVSVMDSQFTKIKGGHFIFEASFKAEKLIRITMEIIDDHINEILISGDFFIEQVDELEKLENELAGCKIEKEILTGRIERFFTQHQIHSYGATAEDFAYAIVKASKKMV